QNRPRHHWLTQRYLNKFNTQFLRLAF
ncbi:capsular exopolysaccharide family domain protein, partial [Vibrio harveyi]